MTRLRTAPELKAAIAREWRHALACLQSTGEVPSPDTAPLLLTMWKAARDKLMAYGEHGIYELFQFRGLHCLVASVWYGKKLDRFYLRDRYTGRLLLAGTANGLLLVPPDSPQGKDAHHPGAAEGRPPFNSAMERAPMDGAGS
jgi:hypothetical protein